jgi:serine protease Do
VIVSVDGRPVDRVSALQRVVRLRRVGDVVPVEVRRYGTRKEFRVKLVEAEALARVSAAPEGEARGDAPASRGTGKLGITVEPLPTELAERLRIVGGMGVRVADVDQDGPARNKIIAGGDIVLEVLYPAPRRAVKSVGDLQAAVGALKEGDYVSLLVQSVDPRVGRRVVNIRIGG